MKMIERFANNPLFTPADIKPSHPELRVVCAFNPGATVFDGRRLLLVRVAEMAVDEPGYVGTPVVDLESGSISIKRFRKDDPDLELLDPRFFRHKGEMYLTSLSHLRVATSEDGVAFQVAETPTLAPENRYETFGVEDARITHLDGQYYVNYTGASELGVVTMLARTRDFQTFERMGVVFAPDNKDMALFPEKIDGRYHAFHRPAVKHLGAPSIWLASSDNLLDWGAHHFVAGPRAGRWDSERVGANSSPIKTDAGWIVLYHGSDHKTRYCVSAVLTDLEEPWRVISRPAEPFLVPEESCETHGFVPNVVFHNGTIDLGNGELELYYGGADEVTCGARVRLSDLLNYLLPG